VAEPEPYERVIVNILVKAMDQVRWESIHSGDDRQTVINRACQVYVWLRDEERAGAEIQIVRPDGSRLRIPGGLGQPEEA